MWQGEYKGPKDVIDATPEILLITTGGTIATRHDPAMGTAMSVASGREIIAMLGSLAPALPIRLQEFCNLGSNRIDLETAFRLARVIDGGLREPEVAGCVVTHGTATLEESAFLASLVLNSDKPVIFTGAQRAADEPDSDGPRNLADALRVASHPDARGLGVLVVFNGRILSAIDATKLDASSLDAFSSSTTGPLGGIDLDQIVMGRRPRSYPRFPVSSIDDRVDLIKLAIGADDRLFRAAVRSGARGIVLEAYGRGDVTPSILSAAREAIADGVITVVTSRCPRGTAAPIYGDAGGHDMKAAGAIFAGAMKGLKARILLCAALPSVARDDLVQLFDSYGK